MSAPDGPATPPRRIRPYLQAQPAASPDGSGGPSTRPRPFVLTSGRVDSADPEINLETQVTIRRDPPPSATPVSALAPELQAIVAMCAEPIAVAEISARVPLHLGVARILVGDLRASGHLDVHTQDAVNPHDPEIIMRVIRGLRAIA